MPLLPSSWESISNAWKVVCGGGGGGDNAGDAGLYGTSFQRIAEISHYIIPTLGT